MNPLNRDFLLETPLASIAGIVVPVGASWARFGQALAIEIGKRVGRAPPVSPAEDDFDQPQPFRSHRILVGTVHTNPLIAWLYRRKHTLVDDFYPGPGGWVIQTVHNPSNLRLNVIVIGLSDPAMIDEALRAFSEVAAVDGGVLGYVNRVQTRLEVPRLSPLEKRRWKRKVRATFRANTGRDALDRGIESGLVYALTGHPEYLELFMFALRHYHELVKRAGGEWEFEHMLFPYSWIWRLAWLWDMVEESSLLTDEDRFEGVTVLCGLADYCSRLVYFRDPSLRTPAIRQNHPTFAALSLFFAARYVRAHYESDAYGQEMEAARLIFEGQRNSFKPDDDANGYCWLVPSHLLHYDLAHDDLRWIEDGHLREVCEYAELTTDNLMAPVGFGDVIRYYPAGWCYGSLRFVLTAAAAFYQSGAWRRLLPEIPPSAFDLTPRHAEMGNYLVDSVGHYARDLKEEGPVLSPGLQLARLTTDAYRHLDRTGESEFQPYRPEGVRSDQVPPGKAFDKCVLRAGYDPDDAYLILDGVSGFVHDHEDAGSVLRLTWKNRMWLTEGDYIRSLPKFHNSLVSICDGQAGPLPKLASLEFVHERGEVLFLQIRVADYNGVDWRRNIVWKRNAWFLFVDTVDFRQEADYVITLFWRLLGKIRSSARSTTVRQDGVLFRMTHGDSSLKSLSDEHSRVIRTQDGSFHRDYPHATDPTRVLRQERRARGGGPGSGLVFFNLMTCGDAGQVGACRLQGLADGVARFIPGPDDETWTIDGRAGIRAGDDGQTDLIVVSEAHLRYVHCRSVRIGGRSATFSEPVFLEIDRARGRAVVLGLPGSRVSGDLLKPVGLLAQAESHFEVLSPDVDPEYSAGSVRPDPCGASAETLVPEAVAGGAGIALLAELEQAASAVAWSASLERLFVLEGNRRLTTMDLSGRQTGLARLKRPASVIRPLRMGGAACVVVGGAGYLEMVDASGLGRWLVALLRSHYRIQNVNDLSIAVLEEGEEPSILACTDGWLVHCITLSGRRRWVTQIHHHAARSMVVGDADGDGRAEILVGTEYHTSDLLEADGAIRWTINGGPEFIALGFCDLDRDGIRESIYGAESGAVYAVHSKSGKIIWESNVGDRSQAAVITGPANEEGLIVGSLCGEVVRFDATGRKVWRRNLGGEVFKLADLRPSDGLVAFLRDGRVAWLDGSGRLIKRWDLGSTLVQVEPERNPQTGFTFFLATADRRILRMWIQ
ncbi:MAG: PQQ-binding-like beta-propeller repeat protein [Opitutaceae bacterium]